MTEQELNIRRYPIGELSIPESISPEDLRNYKENLGTFPEELKEETINLDSDQLDTPYRPGGWTIRQVVHHCADSHMNSYIRFKLALTEDNPPIKTYRENKWAELIDSRKLNIDVSLNLLEALHVRWITLLDSFSQNDFEKTFFHPEFKRDIKLKEALCIYSWHCKHHLAHITELKKRMKW